MNSSSTNLPVYCWLHWRKLRGLPQLTKADNFCVVTDDEFDEFDLFRKYPVGRGHDIVVPDLELFQLYCEE